jgi:hypothetical protein
LWPSLMIIICSFCLLQCAGGSWLAIVRPNNVIVEIFEVFHQILFTVSTNADITHDATDQQGCRWVAVLYKTLNHGNWWNKSHWQLFYCSDLWIHFGANVLKWVFQVQDRYQKPYNSGSTSCQYYVCNTMLLTTSAVAFTALLTTNLETVLCDNNCTHFCQRTVLKAATK